MITHAVNIRNNAITLYDNWNFNSYCNYKGVTLAASGSGIFVVGGHTDADDTGVENPCCNIDCSFKTLPSTLGKEGLKRVSALYLLCQSHSPLKVTLQSESSEPVEYETTLPPPPYDRMRTVKVVTARGVSGGLWSIEVATSCGKVANTFGAFMHVESIDPEIHMLKRRHDA